MTEAVRRAESSVHAQFYIMALDQTTEPLVEALEAAHRRGVTVRVLIDHLGSVGFPGYKEVVHRLDAAGVPWRRMLPVRPWRGEYQRPDLRNHRKIVVVDGRVAFTGSQNVIDRSYNKESNRRKHLQWKDLMVRLEGPVVHLLNALFVTDLSSETDDLDLDEMHLEPPVHDRHLDAHAEGRVICQVLPSGPGFDNQSNLRLFNQLISSARQRVSTSTPYLVPDESLFQSITSAARWPLSRRPTWTSARSSSTSK